MCLFLGKNKVSKKTEEKEREKKHLIRRISLAIGLRGGRTQVCLACTQVGLACIRRKIVDFGDPGMLQPLVRGHSSLGIPVQTPSQKVKELLIIGLQNILQCLASGNSGPCLVVLGNTEVSAGI